MNDENHFQQIQREFSLLYPFLKIALFDPFNRLKPSLKEDHVSSEEEILDVAANDPLFTINMEGSHTVAELVKEIRDLLGFSVIIQRRLGSLWIGTFLTSDWTLERQNREGEHISGISGNGARG
jgi:hypothetical protein